MLREFLNQSYMYMIFSIILELIIIGIISFLFTSSIRISILIAIISEVIICIKRALLMKFIFN